jgi:hypothetical protein
MAKDISDLFYSQLGESGDVFNRQADPFKGRLAHYTSIETLTKILEGKELWFSNPLFMNDIEEMRFGLNSALEAFHQSEHVKRACRSKGELEQVHTWYFQQHRLFDQKYALDVYVFCLSEHPESDFDGKLSMWRGYAENGNGAAIVFDMSKIEPVEGSPFHIAKVKYKSTDERVKGIQRILELWANLVVEHRPEDQDLHDAVFFLFRVFVASALSTKHHGFSEEIEWRVIYSPSEEDNELVKDMFSYKVTRRGIEPLLKFPVVAKQGISGPSLDLSNIIDRIILGPTLASSLAKNAFTQMLDRKGMSWLSPRVHSSSIPFRPT